MYMCSTYVRHRMLLIYMYMYLCPDIGTYKYVHTCTCMYVYSFYVNSPTCVHVYPVIRVLKYILYMY